MFTAAEGDVAYVKWSMRVVSLPGPDGKPALVDNGVWEIVGASGKFKGLQGKGTLHINRVSPTDRKFILEGDLVPSGADIKK